jgi:hypothetical protein
VLVQPEMERGRSPLVSIPPIGAGIFKASGSTDPMKIWKQRKEQVPALLFIVSMSPPGYPSAWLRPRRARFRFSQQDHCGSTTSIRLNFRMGRQNYISGLSSPFILTDPPTDISFLYTRARLTSDNVQIPEDKKGTGYSVSSAHPTSAVVEPETFFIVLKAYVCWKQSRASTQIFRSVLTRLKSEACPTIVYKVL